MYVIENEEKKVKYNQIIYSGGALNRATLKISEQEIPRSNIKSITISSPIIDTTQDYFYLGTFIGQKVEIQFKNANDIDLNGIVELKIGTKIEEADPAEGIDGYIDIPMGYYIIDTSPEDYYKNTKITCYDKSILFKNNIDISQWFDEEEYIDEETQETLTRKTSITAENLLINLCNYFLKENMLGTYPTLNKDKRIASFDNTLSGKTYISYIAEIMGGNAKIGRDGKLYIVPLKQEPKVTINAKKSKSWTLGEKYKISRVYYEDGTRAFEEGNKDNNSLNIRVDNPFMQSTQENSQEIITNLYNELKDFEMYSVKNENYGDPTLDAWDLIEFKLDDNTYYVLNDNILKYEMNIATTIETKIPTKQKQEITNVISTEENKIKKMRVDIDQINNSITQIFHETANIQDNVSKNEKYYNEQITSVKSSIDGLTTNIIKSGGENLLMNTAPYRITSQTTLENWKGNIYYKNENRSINKTALLLKNGVVSQTIDIVQGNVYALGFKYDWVDNTTTKCIINYNGRKILISENGIKVNTIEDSADYVVLENGIYKTPSEDLVINTISKEITSYGVVNTTTFTIEFTCDIDDGFEIYELRLVQGAIITPWTQNRNEIKSKSVNIGDGITIDSEQANTVNNIDTNGMVVTNKTTNTEVLVVDDEKVETNKLISKSDSNINSMLVQKIGQQVFITSII